MGKIKEYCLDIQDKRTQDKQNFINIFLKDIAYKGTKPNLLRSISISCRCGVSCKLGAYYKHCHSKNHTLYLQKENLQGIYCIVDSNIDISTEVLEHTLISSTKDEPALCKNSKCLQNEQPRPQKLIFCTL
jgi:hypothetical protein